MINYPSVEKIVEFNLLALSVIKVKKADSVKLLSKAKLEQIVLHCKQTEGDLFDKSVILLKGIIKLHPFASGNRRTAFIAMKYFLTSNAHKIGIDDNPDNAKTMLGIREGYYSDEEIKEWIKNGKIRQFKR